MAILNDIGEKMGLAPDPFPRESMFTLSQLGRQKATAFEAEGPELRVLTALHERGPSDLTEIVRSTGFEAEKCKIIIRKLIRQKLVQRV